ncbi:hypothetical protein D9M70_444700 [compost metagenome]
MQVVEVGPTVLAVVVEGGGNHLATDHHRGVVGLHHASVVGLVMHHRLPVVVGAEHQLPAGIAHPQGLSHRQQVARVEAHAHGEGGSHVQAGSGRVPLAHQDHVARLRVGANQVRRPLLLQAVGPIGFVAAGVGLLLRVQHLQAHDVARLDVAHGHQGGARAGGIAQAEADHPLAVQVVARPLFGQTLPHARGPAGGGAVLARLGLGRLALALLGPSLHHCPIFGREPATLGLDLLPGALFTLPPVPEGTAIQGLSVAGQVLIDHVPAGLFRGLIVLGLAALTLPGSHQGRLRLQAVVLQLVQHIVEQVEVSHWRLLRSPQSPQFRERHQVHIGG